jgi:hypothetical protein
MLTKKVLLHRLPLSCSLIKVGLAGLLCWGISPANAGGDGLPASAVNLPVGTSEVWWSKVQGDLTAIEYHATPQQGGLQAPNRAQGLRTHFDESGALSVPQDAKSLAEAPWQWGLSLQGYGWAGGEMTAPAQAAPQAQGNTVTYQRGPELREWYVNDPSGLRSWYEVKSAPEGTGEILRLELSLRGNTTAAANAAGDGIEFFAPGGTRVVNYSGLKAWDAAGHELPCRLELSYGAVVLDVTVAGAAFPITIDPLASSAAWTAEGSQADTYFGGSVASAGDVNGDGYSDVIVGAWLSQNGFIRGGRAFVYLGSASGLSSSAAWTADGDQNDASFGYKVASAGDVNGDGYSDVIVGAPWYSNGESWEGRVFVYFGSASGLGSSAVWTVESNQAGAQFGTSVASAGDVNGDGYSDVIVGAPWYSNGESGEGRVFVYFGSASGLGSSAVWTAESNKAGAQFGTSVASAGDVNGDGYSDVIVGAHRFTNSLAEQGRAYVYLGSPSGLANSVAWIAEGTAEYGWFGRAVASAGDVNGDGFSDVIVSALDSGTGALQDGAVYVYQGSASGLTSSPAWFTKGPSERSALGSSVASAGDVNGDGYSDIIVGLRNNYGGTGAGIVFLYLGSASGIGLASSPAWFASTVKFDGFGEAVASAGDVNGDGFDDAVVGASLERKAYVYTGAASGFTPQQSTEFPNQNGWVGLGQGGPLFTSDIGSRGFDGANGALIATVGASPRGRIIGWLESAANDMPYSAVGSGNFVRAKFHMVYSGPGNRADMALANRVPNFRLSLRTRGVVNTQLEINHNAQTAGSPSQLAFTRELGPSKDPARPSIYRVDLDPVDVPYLAASPDEGIQRGFETVVSGAAGTDYSFVSGVLSLTESSIGTYPALGPTIPLWTVDGRKLFGPGDFDRPSVVLTTLGASTADVVRYSAGPDAADFWNPSVVVASVPEPGITMTRSALGVTVNSAALATTRIGVADAAFIGSTFERDDSNRLRAEPGALYVLKFRLSHAGASDTTPYTRVNLRTIGFGYNATLELLGGRGLAAADARTFLSQVMPGVGNQVPDTTVDGTTYRLLFNSPMHPEIRNDVGGALNQKFPQIMALPGPGVSTTGPSPRDFNMGFTVVDSLSIISPTENDPAEVANDLTLNRIEISRYPQIAD